MNLIEEKDVNASADVQSGNSALQAFRKACNRLWEGLVRDWRWVGLYVIMLALGAIGDLAYCRLPALPAFWAEVLPNVDYIAIICIGVAFGPEIGLAGSVIMGISRASIFEMTGAQTVSQLGHLVTFAVVGVLAGWMAKRRTGAHFVGLPKSISLEERSHHRLQPEFGHLVPGFAHQFRTPIASIEGAGFVLEDAALADDKRHEFVGIIHKECRRLDLLVGLLDYSQARASDYREVDVGRLLAEVIQPFRTQKDISIAFRVEVGPDLPRLRCDPEMIKQAMANLVTNAIHAMPHGGDILLWARREHGEMIIGLTDQRIDNRSEHLYRFFDVASMSYESSEVDLAIVQQIINRHGGWIRVEPNAIRGVTVFLTLPNSE